MTEHGELQDRFQRADVIVFRVMRDEQRGSRALMRCATYPIRQSSGAETHSTSQDHGYILPQLRAGRGTFYLGVKMQGFLANAARPEALDQETKPVLWLFRWFIQPFGLDYHIFSCAL